MTWYWLSFVDPDGPEGDRFLGVSIVQAADERQSLRVARELGCNPGGEVMVFEYASEDLFELPDASLLGRLLSAEELTQYDLGYQRS